MSVDVIIKHHLLTYLLTYLINYLLVFLSVSVCCQSVQEVVSGRNVADVCGRAVIQGQFVQIRAAEDVAVQMILPSGTGATVSLLTSVEDVRTQH